MKKARSRARPVEKATFERHLYFEMLSKVYRLSMYVKYEVNNAQIMLKKGEETLKKCSRIIPPRRLKDNFA